MVADGVNLARVLGRLEAAALSPSAGRPPAPLTSLLAEPFDRFEPPTVDQALAAVLASTEPPTTSPGRAPGRTARPIAAAPSTSPAPRSDPGAVDSGRWLAPRRWSPAAPSPGSSQAERPPSSADAAADVDAENRIGRPTPSRGQHPQPTWRSVMPVRVGASGGHRQPAGQHHRPTERAAAGGRPSIAQLRRWADTTSPASNPGAAPTQGRAGSSQPAATRPVTPSAGPGAPMAPSPSVGVGLAPHPAPAPAPSSGPVPNPGRTPAEISPSTGPTSSPRQPLSLRTLGAAWQEQATPTDTASQPASSIVPVPPGSPPASATPAAIASTPPRSLDRAAELAGADVDLESTLMTMLERGLRAEARRYGVDLEGWEIQ